MSGTANDIRDLVNRFNGLVQDLQDAINDVLDWVPWGLGWLADKIRDLWNGLMGKIKEFFDPLVEILSNLGEPSTVSSKADLWSSNVGSPVSARVALADVGSLAVDDNWKGSAADQYKQKAPLQKTALQNVKTQFTDGISSALKDVSSAIQVFFGLMIAAIGAWIAAIITALGATATIFGIPAGILIAIAAVAGFGAAFWGAGESLKSQCRSARTLLEQKDVGEHRLPERGVAGGHAVTSSGVEGDRAAITRGTARSLVAGVLVVVNLTLIALWSSVASTLPDLRGPVVVASIAVLAVGIICLVGVIVLGTRWRGTHPPRGSDRERIPPPCWQPSPWASSSSSSRP